VVFCPTVVIQIACSEAVFASELISGIAIFDKRIQKNTTGIERVLAAFACRESWILLLTATRTTLTTPLPTFAIPM
jgi:hypothetical protein